MVFFFHVSYVIRDEAVVMEITYYVDWKLRMKSVIKNEADKWRVIQLRSNWLVPKMKRYCIEITFLMQV